MVYPGDFEVSVELSPANTLCVIDTISDTSCTAEIARNNLSRIIIIQTNVIDSTVDEFNMINGEFIRMTTFYTLFIL